MLSQSQISANIAAASAFEHEILQGNSVGPSEENTVTDNVDPDGDIMMEISSLPISSPGSITDTYQTPEPTEHRLNIASICNPNNEDSDIRQDCTSELFDGNLNAVQIPSWVKNATCE